MASNNQVITLGHLKGPGTYSSSEFRRFLCGEPGCAGGGAKARPDEIQRHVAKVHGRIIDYATVQVQETDPVTRLTTTISAATYVNRIWALAGVPVPPAIRFRAPGPINPVIPNQTAAPNNVNAVLNQVSTAPSNINSAPANVNPAPNSVNAVPSDIGTAASIDSDSVMLDVESEESDSDVSHQAPSLTAEDMANPRVELYRSLVRMTTELSNSLVNNGVNYHALQAFTDRVIDEVGGVVVGEDSEDSEASDDGEDSDEEE